MAARLTIFNDSECTLCSKEMAHLMARDPLHLIRLEPLGQADLAQRYPWLDIRCANQILHGVTADGEVLTGLDVTHAAWSLVGLGWLTAPLRWPGLRWFADRGYGAFATHRQRISAWFASGERCQCGQRGGEAPGRERR
ncbi:DUF393 domain-containing protein [Ferrimonas pelagia]|uniref:DUF393 domain-containing protein n=1 Tax=Ferrimonas pelagia TaxID=1177826 RepID=A0ABP9FGU3_9GAMM